MIGVSSPQERTRSRRYVYVAAALVGVLAVGAPAVAQDVHVHDVSATVLPHNIPDFCAVPGAVMTAASGDWSNPATWSDNAVPGPNDVRVIAPGHDVVIKSTTPQVRVLCVEGSLRFATNANTKLTVGTMLVKPTGSLEMGSASAPVSAANTAEIVIADTPLNDPLMSGYDATRFDGNWVADPEQYGTGIISLGRTTFRGAAKSPTWARVTVEPRAGNRTLTLESAVTGWRAGDRLILPDTRHLMVSEVGDGTTLSSWTRRQGEWEELTIASVSGNVVILTTPLRFDHFGARDADKKLVLLPHVGNLSRNVIVRSANPIGTGVQGHLLFTSRAEVDIRYAAFRDLGRTKAIPCAADANNNQLSAACSNGIEPHVNQIGRYPVHFHHLIGPISTPADGHQFTFSGNAIDGGSAPHTRRWSVAIHASHYGLISENVAYNYAGALFNTEDGTESYNVIEKNFAVRSSGTGGRLGFGNEGMGFWFRGPNNYVRGNVAADFDSDNVEAAYGYKYFMHGQCPGCDSLANIKIPTAPGQDPSQYKTVSGNSLPILQFENNEVYSAAEGLTYWWLSSSDPIPSPNPKASVFKDLRIWHVYNIGIYHYPGARVLFDGLQMYGDVFRADRPDFYACCGRGFHGEDYAATDIRIINSKIHNMWSPFIPSAAGTGRQIIENTELKNTMWSDVGVDTMFSANGPDWLPSRKIILNNVTFRGTEVDSGGSGVTISKEWFTRATSNLFQADQLLVLGFQGSPTDNFEVFYAEQAFSQVAGGTAPCQTTRAGIQGLVCQTDASRGPVITWLDPWEGSSAGGTIVKISGANFTAGSRVTFDGVPADVRVAQPNSLEVRIPAHTPGSVGVKVENADGLSDELPANYETETSPNVFIRVPIGFTFSDAVEPPPPVNTVPAAQDDSYTTTEDTPLNVSGPGVLGNDADADGDEMTALLVSSTLSGTLTLSADGSFVYVPNAGFSGADSFTYKANDGQADSNVATVTITVNAVNHPPVANDDVIATIPEDALGNSVDVLANDTDIDGDTLSIASFTQPARGVVTIGAEGRRLNYAPNRNACGSDAFEYTVSDGRGGSDIGRVTIDVTCVNDAPQPVADIFTVDEDSANNILDVLANDITVDEGETLNVESCGLTTPGDNMHGTVIVAADRRRILYTPAANFSGTATFTCVIGDGFFKGANAPSASVTVHVVPVNDAPVAAAQAVTTNEDVAKAITLSATDNDSTTLTYSIVTGPQHGILSGTAPNMTYTPAANYSGADSFTFKANDGGSDSNVATVSITISPVNDAPVATAQSVTTAEDTAASISLAATDVEGDPLTFSIVSGPSHGSASVAGNVVTYMPEANYNGPDSLTFKASDGTLSSAAATVSITVTPVNDAAVAADQAISTPEDTAATIALGASDVDRDDVTFAIVDRPSHGTAAISGGSVVYTPALNYFGPDSFTFKANDGTIDSNVATVSIDVTSVNDAPVAANQSVTTDEDAAKAIVLAASDVEDGALTFTIVAGPSKGTLSGTAPNLVYTPNANYNGADSFTFKANDGSADSNIATVTIAVTAVNDAPVAVADSYSVDEDQLLTVPAPGVLGNDSDVDAGATLTAMVVEQPAHGVLVLNANGSFTYTPAANFSGADAFTYKANDGTLDSNVVTVSITVREVNDAPVAQNVTASTDEDTPASISLLATDEDSATLTFAIVTQPQHGAVAIAGNIATYTPAANYNGPDSFTFKASDGAGDSNIATVTIAVKAVNDAAVAVADAYSVNEDATLDVPAPGVLGNDTDIDGEPTLTSALVTGPAHGTLTLNANGSFSYTPNANYSGADSFSYKANDGGLDSNVVTVAITINAVDDAPVAENRSVATDEDTPVAVTLVAVDADSATLTYAVVASPAHGTLSGTAPALTYTPNANFFGTDSFTFKANDGSADSNVATVTITVNPVNDAPVAQADSYAVDEDQVLTVATPGVLGNDTDVDDTTLTAALVSNPAHGTLTLNADGSFSYTPTAGFNGSDSFSYKANDGNLDSNVVAVAIAVNAVNDAPAAVDQSVATDEDAPLAIVLGATDGDSDPLTLSIVAGPQHGTLSGSAPNVIYTPASNYHGADSFTFKANDGSSDSNIATVSITIRPVNDAPVAVADAYSINEDGTLNVAAPGVLGNDTDVDGDSLSAVLAGAPANGVLVLNANGSFSYTPNAGFSGADAFSYKANDGNADSDIVTVAITVTSVNDAPVANDQLVATSEDTPLPIVLTAIDGDSASLTFDVLTQPQHGTLSGSAPNLLYTPADNYFGSDSFTFKAHDGSLDSNVATVNIAIAPVNDAPVAMDDAYATGQGAPLTIAAPGVLGNDSDIDGPAPSAVLEASPAHGTVTLNGDGSFVYQPAAGFNGADSFTYRASDGTLSSAPATVFISVFADYVAEDADARQVVSTDNDGVPGASAQDPIETSVKLSAAAGSVTIGEADLTERMPEGYTFFNYQVNIAAPAGSAADPLVIIFTLDASIVPAGQNAATLAVFRNGAFVANCDAAADASASPDPCVANRVLLADGDVRLTIRTSAASIWTFAVSADNAAPIAENDTYSTSEETPLTVDAPGVLGNDADADGNTLTAALVSEPAHGTVSLLSSGGFTYTPNANFSGTDSFTYKANDGAVDSNEATVTITVTGINDAPVAVDDSESTTEDAAVDIDVAANDTDTDGENADLRVVVGSIADVRGGTASLQADGRTVRFTPAAGANDGNTPGGFGFTYRVTDGTDSSANEATVTIAVSAVNDGPQANADSYTTAEDAALNIAAPGVLENDTDADGDSLSVVLGSGPAHGTLALNPDGSFRYTPNANYHGTDSFTYKASDGTDQSEATASITITPVNDAPVAVADSYNVNEDSVLNVAAPGVLGNDTDADDEGLTAALVVGPSHGTLSLEADGSFRYTPAANYHGADSFTYKANDGTIDSNVVTVSISVAAVNDAPVARDNAYSITEDTELVVGAPGIRGNDTDEDGDALQVTLVSGPAHGTLDLKADGTFRYMPASNFNGRDSFTYKVNDGTADSNVAPVVIDVTPVNDAPVAAADSYSTDEDMPLTIAAPGLLENDTDVDNAALTAVLVGGPAHGELVLNPNGSFTYTPAPGFNGSDSFSYKANDGTIDSNVVSVTIAVTAVNDAPVAGNDAYTTAEDAALDVAAPGVLGNDSDADGTPLNAVLVSGPSHGTLTLNQNGSFRYEPAANYHGPDSFTYKASDGTLEAQATVAITVTSVNDAPEADDDAYGVAEDATLTVPAPGVLDGDTDADGDSLTAAVVSGPAHGALTLNPDGSFSYEPAANFNGTDSFTYKAGDASAGSNIATVTIAVTAVDDAPVAADQSLTTDEDAPLSITLTATDSDTPAASLTFAVIAQPQHGTLSGSAPNLVYTPTANYNGADSFAFKANDGTADSNVATVSITIRAVNDAPAAVDDAFAGVEDEPLVIGAPGVLGNDSEADGDAVSAVQVTGPAHGTLVLNADGSFTYTPALNYSGPDGFTYRASDGTLSSDVVTVSITVAAGNDAPVAMPDAYEIAEGGTLTIPAPGVLANDSDIDGTPLTAVLMGGASNGTVVLGPDGSLVYTPDADFNGIATFTYAAFDGTSNSNVATVTILVTAANDVPVAAADSYSTPEDGELAVDAEHGVLSNDADVEGTPLKAILVGQASHGVVTLNEDGSFTYVPAQNFNGTDTFSYKANDGEADSNVVDVTITADPVNDAPTAAGDSYPAQEDQALTIAAPGVLGNDSDIDGDPLTAIVVSGPQHGSLVLNSDGSFRYTPAANYAGDDSFTYKANDGNADSEVAAVSLTVTGANDAPVAASQSVTTAEDSPLPIVLSASDVDSDALAYSVVSGPSHGSLSGTAPNVVYTPAANYNGPDSFTFKANDGTADSNVATVSITVGGANDAPVAGDDSFSVAEDSMLTVAAPGVLGNDSDIDGNALHAVLATAPAHGTLSLNADGSFTYRPAANYSGADSFTYRANDGSVDSNVATVSITVTAGNDAPVAGNDAYSVAEDTTLTVATPGVLGNDTDSEGDPFTAALVSQPAHGTLTFSADGSFTYVPAANFNGADTFSYRAENASGSSNLATVTINVSAVNDAPKVDPILNQAGLVGKALSLQIVARDLDGDVLRYSATNLPAGLTLNADNGRISGTPLKSGTYVVTVTVSDGVSAVNTTFTWIIQAMKIVLAQPSDQISREGDHVSLGLETTLAERLGKEKRDFSAKNLPRGLRVSKAGEIRGHLKRDSAGVYKVSVTATLGNTSGSVQFNWTVADRDHRGSGDDGDDDSAYSCDRDDHDDEGGDDSSGKGGWDRL